MQNLDFYIYKENAACACKTCVLVGCHDVLTCCYAVARCFPAAYLKKRYSNNAKKMTLYTAPELYVPADAISVFAVSCNHFSPLVFVRLPLQTVNKRLL